MLDILLTTLFKHREAPTGKGYKSSLGHFVIVSSDLRLFLKDPQLKSRGLDVSVSPSGGEMDQVEGVVHPNICWETA